MNEWIAKHLPWQIVSWCGVRIGITVFDTFGYNNKYAEQGLRDVLKEYNWLHTGQ